MKTPSKETMKSTIKYCAEGIINKLITGEYHPAEDCFIFDEALEEFKTKSDIVRYSYVDMAESVGEIKQIWQWFDEAVAEIKFTETIEALRRLWTCD